ncbi:Glycosyltransferase involved in cell wall bisynthesis [Marininema mesophilum]|uniref:Glycosyltransferase involved in cell wall bisynthesis n=1 Tax=Marininema mesophilum TaxID=1048340 RepID=A0A1H2VL06_9BACL|nr:glycosyltransferase [Marininema mesophilum]SDW68938.1 Glycosyltransferase involved in cell wall bisynthesis [Marininema mesophilum]
MISISLCMIVKNEEKTLDKCLSSIHDLVDEINIVDTGSTDKTKEVVGRYTERMFDFKWVDDFAKARNFSFSKATKDYILWLDADDFLKEEDREKFRELKRDLDPTVDQVSMLYNLHYDDKGNVFSRIRRERLVKRSRNYQWHDPVHEYLEIHGKIMDSNVVIHHGKIHHNKARNLSIYEKRLERGETFSPRDIYNYGNELIENGRLEEGLEQYEKYFAANSPYIEDNISACGYAAHCCHLLGKREEELKYLLKSFEYHAPRAEFCCRLGLWYQSSNNPDAALSWYNHATQIAPLHDWGMTNVAARTWIPHLQMAVIYGALGEIEKAYEQNKIVLSYNPDDPQALNNKKKLESYLAKGITVATQAGGEKT